jgi:hypothetical protein
MGKETIVIEEQHNNDIVYIKYNDLEFEIDVIGDIILMDDEVYDLFSEEESHVEHQPLNLFLSRLIKNYNMKKTYDANRTNP